MARPSRPLRTHSPTPPPLDAAEALKQRLARSLFFFEPKHKNYNYNYNYNYNCLIVYYFLLFFFLFLLCFFFFCFVCRRLKLHKDNENVIGKKLKNWHTLLQQELTFNHGARNNSVCTETSRMDRFFNIERAIFLCIENPHNKV